MRRVLLVLVAVFLVNLPFVHEAWAGRQLDRSGRVVQAVVVHAQRAGGRYLVDYRLPGSVDPGRGRYSARVGRTTWEQARQSRVIAVEVVPGEPGTNRPVGEVRSRLFLLVALTGDLILLLVAALGYRRWREGSRHLVVGVDGEEVTLEAAGGAGRLTVLGPDGWAAGLHPGQRVGGRLHLAVDHDVLPDPHEGPGGVEQVHGATYAVRGRVVDAHQGEVVLELADGERLRVQTGSHRIRADLRDTTAVRGTLCFTPSGLNP